MAISTGLFYVNGGSRLKGNLWKVQTFLFQVPIPPSETGGHELPPQLRFLLGQPAEVLRQFLQEGWGGVHTNLRVNSHQTAWATANAWHVGVRKKFTSFKMAKWPQTKWYAQKHIELVSGKNSHEGVAIGNTFLKWDIYNLSNKTFPYRGRFWRKHSSWA